ncbi:MAG TPA: hydrogenase expression/formation protein HypE [Nitrospiria bacterium]|jgi:hydrogenase expression/formation protein HypE|nr:hydrogenase expression/formation protein HypE [Nitrospiria bacterium]
MDEKTGLDPTIDLSCPIPVTEYKNVLLAHGGGGRLTQQMIQKMFLPSFRNEFLESLHDGAVVPLGDVRMAFTTDSYVVKPIVFPGGDIGALAVNGTVNDLAMCGARPLYLSAAFIIEEGFPMEDLWRVVLSMQTASRKAGVLLVTGDTKVVDRGKGDKIFINTSGVGTIESGIDIRPKRVKPGDRIILSGAIALHGLAVMSVRDGLEFETRIESDTAALHDLVMTMLKASQEIHGLRDPTRGGLASALNEIAEAARVGLSILEDRISVGEDVKGACEILGLDPLYVANEGKLVAFVDSDSTERVLAAMRRHPLGKEAAVIGEVVADHPGTVVMKSRIGGRRVVDMLSGEALPRIC